MIYCSALTNNLVNLLCIPDISRTEAVTPKEYRYAFPTDVHGVPVTVVDLVPVTAIDLPEDYGNTVTDGVTKTSPRKTSNVNNGTKMLGIIICLYFLMHCHFVVFFCRGCCDWLNYTKIYLEHNPYGLFSGWHVAQEVGRVGW